MAFLNNGKIMIGEGPSQILHFRRNFLPKIKSALKKSSGYIFWLKKLKNDIKIALKQTDIEV